MKKKMIVILLIFVLMCICLIGCSNDNEDIVNEQDDIAGATEMDEKATNEGKDAIQVESEAVDTKDYSSYMGDYKLKMKTDTDLYEITSLDVLYGYTGISIELRDNNYVTGTVTSTQSAPSYRTAIAEFKGEIIDGTLVAKYEDKGWEYTGQLELVFEKDMIKANIKRDETEIAPLWGIPTGEFDFVRPIETEIVKLNEEEQNKLTEYLSLFTKDAIEPFDEGELTDAMIIKFIGVHIALGDILAGEYNDGKITFSEKVANEKAIEYVGKEIEEPQSVADLVEYSNGSYSVPDIGGVFEWPVVKLALKDTEDENITYFIVNYEFAGPDDEYAEVEYQYLIKFDNINYVAKSVKKIEDIIDFKITEDLFEEGN